jgi:hypothetical protein
MSGENFRKGITSFQRALQDFAIMGYLKSQTEANSSKAASANAAEGASRQAFGCTKTGSFLTSD